MNDFHTADLCDNFPDEVEVCHVETRTFGARPRFHGEIVTLSTFEDAGAVRKSLEQDGRGRVLVVHGGGSVRVAVLGDRLAGIAVTNGWAGVIVFGAIRDSEAIGLMDLGVVATAVTPARGSLAGEGSVGTTFEIGGATFAPGRHVYCDADGIVVGRSPQNKTGVTPA